MSGSAAKLRLCLPKTKFPLRVNPVVQELAIQKAAGFDRLYDWQQGERDDASKTFTLHDGPPYANGVPHMGHLLNKVLKDIVNRYKLMRGFRLEHRPGWDCHGLPIELKACKDMGSATPIEIRTRAADFARQTLTVQREAFKRWGCIGDWDRPYITMDPQYEANQIDVFYRMYERGCIYRGVKPVYWSPSSHTTLAEAELEYRDHTSRAVYVLFPIASLPGRSEVGAVEALVWTTTPWTLVANRAICYNPDHRYSLVRVAGENGCSRRLLLGAESVLRLDSLLGSYSVEASFLGSELAGATYCDTLDADEAKRPFLPGSHVTETDGTGLVHTAPAHGFEDHDIGIEHGLDLSCHVDELGCYTAEAGANLQCLEVLTEGNDVVLSKLQVKGQLFHECPYNHRYPYDWRTKRPVIIRSTRQWFASVRDLKEQAKVALSRVKMHPSVSANRISAMLDARNDWCISRQRVWGVPLPIFYDKQTGEALLTRETVSHVRDLVRSHGTDCWWERPVEELLPEPLCLEVGRYERGTDTMDVWFDSGSSWATVLPRQSEPADLYLEGSDQHRGWFQSSLLTSVAVNGRAPYRAVVTHGFVLDSNGNKMSKSLGNVVSPDDVISKEFGADVMRLWVASSNYTSDVNIGDAILKQTNDVLQKVRVTLRFLLGNLADFDPATHLVPYPRLSRLDRYLLHLLHCYGFEAALAYDSLTFSRLYNRLVGFVPTDLSAFYFDIVKDRLYCNAAESETRRSSQTVLCHLLEGLCRSVAPVLPHLAEEVAQHHHFGGGLWGRGGGVRSSFSRGITLECWFVCREKSTVVVLDQHHPFEGGVRSSFFWGITLECILLCVEGREYSWISTTLLREVGGEGGGVRSSFSRGITLECWFVWRAESTYGGSIG